MPYKIHKLKSGKYRVVNSKSGKVHARETTKEKAAAQVRLLHAKESGSLMGG
jgi:hypothetical protein